MRRVGWSVVLTIATISWAAGCAETGSTAQASCTLAGSMPGATLTVCEEIERASSQDVEDFRVSCGFSTTDVPEEEAQVSSQFTYGACSRVDALGGCQTASGSTIITRWFYDDGTGKQTPSDVQMACTTAGGVFVQA